MPSHDLRAEPRRDGVGRRGTRNWECMTIRDGGPLDGTVVGYVYEGVDGDRWRWTWADVVGHAQGRGYSTRAGALRAIRRWYEAGQ